MNSTFSFSNWRRNAAEARQQIPDILRGFSAGFRELPLKRKLGRIAFAAAIAGACIASIFVAGPAAIVSGGWLVAAQLMGAGAYALSLFPPHMKENRHKLAFQPFVSALGCVHKILLGGFGYAIMGGVAGLRAATISCVPEERKKLRRGIALGYWGIGVAAVTATALATSLWNLAPIFSMTLGTIADGTADKNTRYARLLRTIANANNTFYSLLYSRSVVASFTDSTAAYNGGISIARMDVPKPAPGSVTPFRRRLGYYISNMARFQPMPEFYPQPDSAPKHQTTPISSAVAEKPEARGTELPKVIAAPIQAPVPASQAYDAPVRPGARVKGNEPPIA